MKIIKNKNKTDKSITRIIHMDNIKTPFELQEQVPFFIPYNGKKVYISFKSLSIEGHLILYSLSNNFSKTVLDSPIDENIEIINKHWVPIKPGIKVKGIIKDGKFQITRIYN